MVRGYVVNSQGNQEVIFIHIPKTGGSSISTALTQSRNFKTYPIIQKYSWQNLTRKIRSIPKPARHTSAIQMKRILGKKHWDSCFSFAFIRNPWDLMVSNYEFWRQKASSYAKLREDANKIKNMKNFNEFIDSDFGKNQILECKGNLFNWLCDENKRIIVSFVGRFETLNEDWEYVCKNLELDSPLTIPHQKKTERQAYQEYYNKKSQQIISNRFEWVIKEFGYHF